MELGRYGEDEHNKYGEIPQAEAGEFGELVVDIWRYPEVRQLVDGEPLDHRGFTAGVTVSDLQGRTVTIQEAIPPPEEFAPWQGPVQHNFFEVHVHHDTPLDPETIIRLDQEFIVKEGGVALQKAIVDYRGNTQGVPLEQFQEARRILKEGVIIDASLEEVVPKHYLTGKEASHFHNFARQLWETYKNNAVTEGEYEETAVGAGRFDAMLMQRADKLVTALIRTGENTAALIHNESVTFWRTSPDEAHALTRNEQRTLLTDLQRTFLIFPEE